MAQLRFPISNNNFVAMMNAGLSYGEVANLLGVTRKVVKRRGSLLKSEGYDFVARRGQPIINGLKRCACCLKPQSPENFYDKKRAHDVATSSWCKQCCRLGNLARKYKLSRSEAVSLVRAAGSICRLCGQPFDDKRIPAVDHDHRTNRVREVICCFCNYALGRINDNAETAHRIYLYLVQHGATPCR